MAKILKHNTLYYILGDVLFGYVEMNKKADLDIAIMVLDLMHTHIFCCCIVN